ncbi:Thiolase, N-terminal domain-domain-containing protein [Microdochium bolleyi]|uniref:Thiolase, N-terminal domain-domain-containing protein n=1 Tax=Microdochium bolleyi TaxID=196109 RepID=A0A136ISA2_9PEZI|nr:Thiolase, N-terminal domain-domain-containing protein [Microdochium bolleyi]
MATLARNLLARSPNDIVILSAVRSPITRSFKGGFRDAWPEDILGPVMSAAVARASITPSDVEDVLIGNVLAEHGFAKTGKMALAHAGFPVTTTLHTVNRQCSSSLQALAHMSHAIMAGQLDVGLAGGVESMTRNYNPLRGVPGDVGPTLRSTPVKAAADCLMPMGITSENVATRHGVSRRMQDEFALLSHSRAAHAQASGRFRDEIVPVEYATKVIDGTNNDETTPTTVNVKEDDTIRPGVTMEKLANLKPAFRDDGASTAGNSSQISDGASASILARRSWADERGLTPVGRFLGIQVAGCEPDEMGIGPLLAIPRLYRYIGLEQRDVDIFELNEAFASQTLACIHGLGLNVSKVNPNGGAIALGHPTGATGTRQLATLLAELTKQDKEIGVVSMCASTGQGVAAAFIREH